MTPFTVTDKLTNTKMGVPCGKCPACFARRTSQWSFRLMQEEQQSSSAHFITLTYDTKHVPITKNGFMGLAKRDVQLFLKRLRKLNPEKLKYFAVGEYGGRTKRPHYHLILFNAAIDTIQPAWNLGDVHYGTVGGASIGYTLKYMSKVSKIPMHANDDRLPEFGLMSKKLGANYLTDAMRAWHLADPDKRMYVNLLDGKKIAMPRYYKEKVYTEEQRKKIGLATRAEMLKATDKLIADDPMYFRNKFQAHQAAFHKMRIAHDKNNKI